MLIQTWHEKAVERCAEQQCWHKAPGMYTRLVFLCKTLLDAPSRKLQRVAGEILHELAIFEQICCSGATGRTVCSVWLIMEMGS